MITSAKPALVSLVLVAAYVALAKVAMLFSGAATDVSLIWPSSGILFAAMLKYGWRWWPAAALAVLISHLLLAPVPLAFLPWSVMGNVLGGVAGCLFVRRVYPSALERFDITTGAGLLAGGVILAGTSALVGCTGMVLSGMSTLDSMPSDALRWAVGDLFGTIAIAPATLMALDSRQHGRASLPQNLRFAGRIERAVWAVLMVIVIVGISMLSGTHESYALAIVSLPLALMIWAAVRLPPRVTTYVNAVVSLLLATAVSLGFAGFKPPTRAMDAATLAAFLCVIALTPLTLAMGIHQARTSALRLLRRATSDLLTGTLNRSAFELHVRQLAKTDEGEPMALVYLDLDRFRLINDGFSHAVGDELIAAVAGVLQARLKPDEKLARIGGDEFAALLRRVDPDSALDRARELCEAVASYRFMAQSHVASTTASGGLVPFVSGTIEFAALLAQADTACFAAKERGGNRVERVEPGGEGLVQERSASMRWALRLSNALEHDHFQLHCQTIAPLRHDLGALRHFEVLLRMREPGSPEPLLPAQFIDAAERFGMGVRLDRHVVEKTLRWFDRHPDHAAQVGLCSINLSAASIDDERFLEFLSSRLRRSSLSPEQICFELTETSALGDLGRAQQFISAVRNIGCRFALDDFGTGFCSFGYLRALDVDFFKIDGSFVREIDASPLSYAVVRSIADIGRVMRKQTVAECCETESIRQRLTDLGVDYCQGYAVSRPVDIHSYFGIALRSAVA